MRTMNGLRVQKKLTPGQPGTKRYFDMYGDRPVCAWYRADETQHRRYTTVELVGDERVLNPAAAPGLSVPAPSMEELASVRIAYEEETLRRKVKEGGGRWDKDARVGALW
jgi:hypothetical protein